MLGDFGPKELLRSKHTYYLLLYYAVQISISLHTYIVREIHIDQSKHMRIIESKIYRTRKHPLLRYFLGVLTHTTAWDQEGYVALKTIKG